MFSNTMYKVCVCMHIQWEVKSVFLKLPWFGVITTENKN